MQASSSMYARDITIFCPFLVVNKTHLALRVIDTAPLAETPSIAPPLPDNNIAQPLLFRCFPGHLAALSSVVHLPNTSLQQCDSGGRHRRGSDRCASWSSQKGST